MSVKEIEAAIERLPAEELAALATWFERHHQDAWDEQIEKDLDSGRLDSMLAKVDADYQAGLAKPL